MKIHAVGAELFHVDRRTGVTKPIVAFRNFANAPKNLSPFLNSFFLLRLVISLCAISPFACNNLLSLTVLTFFVSLDFSNACTSLSSSLSRGHVPFSASLRFPLHFRLVAAVLTFFCEGFV